MRGTVLFYVSPEQLASFSVQMESAPVDQSGSVLNFNFQDETLP